MQGKLIVIEGSDGSGKTTQVELLRSYLEKHNRPHILFDFPRYSDSFHAKIVAKYLSGEFGEATSVNPYLASLAYALDRMGAREDIYYALNDGKIILTNRYVPSNKAHQGAKLPTKKRKGFFEWLDELEYKVNKVPREDVVIFLYVPTKVSFELAKKRERSFTNGKPDGHESNQKYQQEVEKTYLQLSKGKDWVKINCVEDDNLRTKEDIHQEILKVLKKKKIL